MGTKTGVKDKYFSYFAEKLTAACAEFKEAQSRGTQPKGNQPLQEFLKAIRAAMPDDLFNPILRLSGWLVVFYFDYG
jgi:hypothetical protein